MFFIFFVEDVEDECVREHLSVCAGLCVCVCWKVQMFVSRHVCE